MEEDRIEKLEEEFEENGEISKHSRSMRMIFIGIAAGLLACIIGAATRTPEAMYAGVFITPISLFSGGLLLNRLGACCTNPSSQMISSGKIEASGEGGRDGVQLD